MTNHKTALAEILENWLDGAMSTSMLSVGVNGYKGSEENIDERRETDYHKELDKALAQLEQYIQAQVREARADELSNVFWEMGAKGDNPAREYSTSIRFQDYYDARMKQLQPQEKVDKNDSH